ncbi:hypothetical protein V502_05835 [Pseudogymnoascus sp. VKM F-4520 (FW-2644)]|nr:hypothetical protein V502_05835 [Pseudogymnoascus sp. VKM F-4520 (FW-2644)]
MAKTSNYLMTLFIDIFNIFFPLRMFKLEGYVILHCLSAEHAAICEVLCSTLAQLYITDRGGFNHEPARISVTSANDVPAADWRSYIAAAINDIKFVTRIDTEIALRISMRNTQHRSAAAYITANKEVQDARLEMEVLLERAMKLTETRREQRQDEEKRARH